MLVSTQNTPRVRPILAHKPAPGLVQNSALNWNMEACWMFNEGGATSDVHDACSPPHNAQMVDHPLWQTGNGLFSDAPWLKLNGTSQYGQVMVQDGLEGASDFSIFARVWLDYSFPAFDGNSIFPQIIARNSAFGGGIDGWNLDLIRPNEVSQNSNKLRLIFKTPGRSWGTDQVLSTSTFTASQWLNVCVVRVGTVAKIYINGALQSTATVSAAAVEIGSFPEVNIGYKADSMVPVFWRGGMDIIRYWSRGISDGDVAILNFNPYEGIN